MLIYYAMSALMGIAVLMYVRYCLRHGRIHRDTTLGGWWTKEESPRHFWFGIITLTILGLVIIVGPFVWR